MKKLDQLAIVLGAVVVTKGVSLVPRPLKKGRPFQKRKSLMTKEQAQHLADFYAQDAFDSAFQSRRGVWHIEDMDCLLLYNNNPYEGDDSKRPNEMKRIEARLQKIGIKTLARGASARGASKDKIDGGDAPYTVTLLLDCSDDRIHEVSEIVDQVTMASNGVQTTS